MTLEKKTNMYNENTVGQNSKANYIALTAACPKNITKSLIT